MSLKDTLKRAAGLVIEFAPEDESTPTAGAATSSSSTTDKMWNDLEESVKPETAAQNPEPNTGFSGVRPTQTPTPRTVEQIVRDAAGPNLDQISVTGADLPDVFGPDGTPHFAPIYTRAGLPPVTYSAEQMLEMLTSLPRELELATRRQAVNAMLKGMGAALGASPETIVADASRKLAALAAYVETSTKQGDDHLQTCQREIQSFEAQILDRRQSIQAEQARQAKITQACTDRAGQLHQVLEFFSKDPQSASQP